MGSGLGCNPSGKKLSIPFALHIACSPQGDRVRIVCNNLYNASGQNLFISIYISDNVYAIIVGTVGLLLVASLIVNMQTYLLSVTAQLEEWRLKKDDIEEWMHYRQLPPELKLHVQRYIRHKWLATKEVPVFDHMNDLTLDAICERLEPTLYTMGMYLICEGDPVTEIFFIIRGNLDSCTTYGGRSGSFSSSQITAGGLCGEELLIWSLDPRPTDSLPSSTRTIKALSDVETFCVSAETMRFIVLQFPTLHSTRLRHKVKFYSQQWRTWAACHIQAPWRRYRRRKELVITSASEYSSVDSADIENNDMDIFVPRPDAGLEVYAARLITNMRRDKSNMYHSRLFHHSP